MDKTMTRRFIQYIELNCGIRLLDVDGIEINTDLGGDLDSMMDAFVEDTWRTWHTT